MGVVKDIFGGIFNATYGRKLQSRARSIQRQQLGASMNRISRDIAFRRDIEDPRERAGLKQSMFARGLGKSTIFDQDRARLERIQENRLTSLADTYDLLRRQRSLIKKQAKYGRIKLYGDIGADILDAALMAFTGTPNMPGGNWGQMDSSFSGPDNIRGYFEQINPRNEGLA